MLGFCFLVGMIAALCLNGYLARNASDVAEEKGYEKRKWFHMCFWLGLPSYLILIAMPDRKLHEAAKNMVRLQQEMIRLQQEMISKLERLGAAKTDSQATTAFFEDLPKL